MRYIYGRGEIIERPFRYFTVGDLPSMLTEHGSYFQFNATGQIDPSIEKGVSRDGAHRATSTAWKVDDAADNYDDNDEHNRHRGHVTAR
jgi:hypothetical protein